MARSKKKRECPALGRTIERVECAQWRHREVTCPADCEHNPFAPRNYPLFKDMEERLVGASLRRLMETGSGDAFTAFKRAAEKGKEEEIVLYSLQALYFEKDSSGFTFMEGWLGDSREKWKNDERLFFEYMQGMRPAFLEVRAILDDTCIEVLDLLRGGERLLVCDNNLAEQACRFDALFAWIIPMPHYYRLSGIVSPYQGIGDHDPFDVFCELLRHHGADPESVGDDLNWFFSNQPALSLTRERIASERHRRLMDGVDLKYWYGNYKNAGPERGADLVVKLDRHPDLNREDPEAEEDKEEAWETDHWVWLGGESTMGVGRSVLGTLRYNAFSGNWRIEAMTRARYDSLTKAFTGLAGAAVRMTGEEDKDLGAEMEGLKPSEPIGDLPAALLEKTDMLAPQSFQMPVGRGDGRGPFDFSRKLFQNWLQAEIPALGGKTPAAAAKDPALAEAVLHRVKEQINAYDQRNLGAGQTGDVADLIREHGLPDPGEPPPPKRPPRRSLTDPNQDEPPVPFPDLGADDASSPEDEEFDDIEMPEFCEVMAGVLTEMGGLCQGEERLIHEQRYRALPLAGPPKRALKIKALKKGPMRRLEEAENPEEILIAIVTSNGPDFLANLDALLRELDLGEQERGAFTLALLTLWICLVPADHRKPLLSIEEMRRRYHEQTFPPVHDYAHVSDLIAYLCEDARQTDPCLLALMEYLRSRHEEVQLSDPPEVLVNSYPGLLLLRVLCEWWSEV